MARRVFVDAMNLIRGEPSLARLEDTQGPAAARRALLRLCRDYIARSGDDNEYIIVFDGGDDNSNESLDDPALLVRYAGERSADEVIIEQATDAQALGYQAWVVSNDNEVRAAGSHVVRPEVFYEALIRRPPPTAPVSRDILARRLVAHLAARGHVPTAADDGLVSVVKDLLDYYLPAASMQKLAKKIEAVLRERTRVTPDPDPQKTVQRELKVFLEQESAR